MANASIEIKGVDKLVKKLGAVEGTKVVKPPMQRSVLRLESRMKKYPPTPPRSSYRRTGLLGRSWTSTVKDSGSMGNISVEGRVGNRTHYAPRVQSAKFQKPIFKRIGWTTDQAALQAETPAIVKDFQDAIEDALK
jgi:hypothetical protein